DVYSILSMVIEVGGLIGEHEEALNLSTTLLAQVEDLRSLRKPGRRPRVYVEIDLGGPTIPAYFSHVTSAFTIAGIDNVFAGTPQSYLYGMKVNDYRVMDVAAELKRRNPDVIVFESKSFKPDEDEGLKIMRERGLESLEAVETGKVLTLPADTLAHYGPSFIVEARKVVEKIYSML
ncbi:MAG: ABC transporter substrate-binding protein, partial [Nitrososphaerota archaeon]|nr:ABC transporter substrate-binding protein [Nitrososphaerota archaeon]